jgi:hypothetical protein
MHPLLDILEEEDMIVTVSESELKVSSRPTSLEKHEESVETEYVVDLRKLDQHTGNTRNEKNTWEMMATGNAMILDDTPGFDSPIAQQSGSVENRESKENETDILHIETNLMPDTYDIECEEDFNSTGEEIENLPQRSRFAQQDDLDEIKQMIIAVERPINYQRTRNKALFGVDSSLMLVAKKHGHRISKLDLAEIPVVDVKSYVAHRTIRTHDNSKRKAPPLPKASSAVKLRNPLTHKAYPEVLLRNVLSITAATSNNNRTSSAYSQRSMDVPRGPYYESPFEPAPLPYRLPHSVTRPIDTTFFAYDKKARSPPSILKSKTTTTQERFNPKNSPISKENAFETLMNAPFSVLTRQAFVETVNTDTPRYVEASKSTNHVVPSNPCFVRYFKKLQEKPIIPEFAPYNGKMVHSMILPALKISTKNNRCPIIVGVDGFRTHTSLAQKLQIAYHKPRLIDHSMRYLKVTEWGYFGKEAEKYGDDKESSVSSPKSFQFTNRYTCPSNLPYIGLIY